MTRTRRNMIRRLVAGAVLVAASAWAGPCIICAGCEGGFARSDGAAATQPCVRVVICVPCRGEPYFIP